METKATMNDIEDPIVYPENPPWTMFFDGPLYEKYKDFMMTKDFSQILLKNKLKIAHQSTTVPEVPDTVDGIDWWSVDQDVTGKSEKQFASDTYNSVSDDFYRKFTRGKREEKRRTRRTRAIILLIILVLLGVSLGTALIIHYFFVPTDDNQVPAQVNISFSGNTSIFGMTTDMMKVKENTLDKAPSLHELLNVLEPDKTKASADRPGLQNNIAVLPNAENPPLVKIVSVSSAAPTISDSTSTTPSTSPSTSPSRIPTVSTESSTPELPIDTGTFNALDFFGMDDTFTTSELPTTVPVTKVKVSSTKEPIKSTVSTETLRSTTTTEALKTTSVTATETTTSVLQETTTAFATTKLPKTASSSFITTATTARDTTESFPTNEPTTKPVQEVISTPQHSMTNSTTQTMTMTPAQTTKPERPATTSTMPSNSTTTSTPMTTTTATAVPPEITTAAATTTTTQAPATMTSQATTTMTSQATTTMTSQTTTTTTTQATTTTIPETTTEVMPQINVNGSTTYKSEMATITCTVTDLGRFKSLTISELKEWEPVTVTMYRNGSMFWSYTKTERHDAAYEYQNITGSDLKQLTFTFIIKHVECQDSGTFKCAVNTDSQEVSETARLFVVGRPDDKIELEIGPAIVEDRALRITAIWQAGYPIPWTNMSWTALDADNQTYNLADYGEYRDYELKEDHFQCRTFLETSIVIFPKIHLNDTTVIVKPNLVTTRFFLEEPMIEYLKTVKYAVEKILVIPLNYCQNGSKEMSIPHPYTTCEKFVWCLPGDLVVQQCPIGTCFIEKLQECL